MTSRSSGHRLIGVALAMALASWSHPGPAGAHDDDAICRPGDAGKACEKDGNKCTREKCDAEGKCVSTGKEVECHGPVGDCDNGKTCDPKTGSCVDRPDKPEGTPCEVDRNKCTEDACNDDGYCIKGPVKSCDDDDVCTDDSCDEDTGECRNVEDPSNDPVCTDGTDVAVEKDASCECGALPGAAATAPDGEVVGCTTGSPDGAIVDGCAIAYTITVTNAGAGSVTGVQVTDVLPDTVAFVGSSATQGLYDPETGIWDVGDLGSAGSAMLTLDVSSASSPDGSFLVTNCAELSAVDPADGNPENDSDCVVVELPAIDDACVDEAPAALRRKIDRATRLVIAAADAGSPGRARKLWRKARRAIARADRAIGKLTRSTSVSPGCVAQLRAQAGGMSTAVARLAR